MSASRLSGRPRLLGVTRALCAGEFLCKVDVAELAMQDLLKGLLYRGRRHRDPLRVRLPVAAPVELALPALPAVPVEVLAGPRVGTVRNQHTMM